MVDAAQRREVFGRLLGQVARHWRRAVDQRLQAYGLTEATWLPMLHLARAPQPMRQKALAASLALDSSTVVRLLDALQSAGLIERREDPDDRRAKAIFLTATGQALVAQVEATSAEVRGAVLAGVGDAELEAAEAVLEKILAALAEREG
ncbi:MarR family winged helix-turn-helix transcriptional regulator [Roseomonas sp. 18066]|uniref:MarR family winged helix-turn-helix transcriptional regulator n=1 Tax=Roseomonas sp. 18066 TaxID=2681412 RepID=UPI00135AA5B0|nr:MarR family transcriptional regulator [Roseomonas sp. 18066]